MLKEQINSAVQLMETVNQVKNSEVAKKYTVQTNNTFFAAFDTFSSCMESYLLLKNHFPLFCADDSLEKEIREVSDVIKKVIDEKKVFRIDYISKTVTRINDRLEKQWQAFFDNMNHKTLEDITILMQVSEQKTQLLAMYKAIIDSKNWPVSDDTLNRYQEAITESTQFLSKTKFDQEIEDFLKKVKDRTATLSDLTPSILEWLEAENLTGKISLSIRK